MDNVIIGIGIPFGICFFFLYTRAKKWSNPMLRWIICIVLFLLGLSGLVLMSDMIKDGRVLYWGLCVPILYYGMDRLFRYLSIKFNGRDFVLWLKGSDEIDDSFGGKNPHVKPLDMLLSFGLLIFIVFITIMGGFLFKNN